MRPVTAICVFCFVGLLIIGLAVALPSARGVAVAPAAAPGGTAIPALATRAATPAKAPLATATPAHQFPPTAVVADRPAR